MNRLLLFSVALTLATSASAATRKAPPAAPTATPAVPAAPPEASPEPRGPDRSRPPIVVEPKPFAHPPSVRLVDEPGLIIDFVRVPEALDVSLDVTWKVGARALAATADRPHAEAMATLWDVATTTRSPSDVAAFEAARDLDVVSTFGNETTTLALTVPRTSLSDGLDFFGDLLLHPSFPKDEVQRWIRDAQDERTTHAPSNLRAVYSLAFAHAWTPAGTPDDPRPDPKALAAVKRDALAALHQTLLLTAPVHAWITGDLTEAEARASIVAAPWWAEIGANANPSVPPVALQLAQDAVIAVDLPSASQAIVGMVLGAPARDHADRAAFGHASYALVGPFLSRLNRNLREDKGWTYGVGGAYVPERLDGYWSARGTYTASNIAGVLREMDAELQALAASGPTAEEIDANIREQVTAFNDAMLDAGSAMSWYASGVPYGETIQDAAKRLDAMRAVTPETAAAAARRWFSEDAPRLILVVGRRADVEPQLTAAGLKATWISAQDAVDGTFDAVTTVPTTPAAP
jgi:predicted Zn-dependent peptidase